MRVGAAYTLIPDLAVKERAAPAERAALERLAAWAYQYTSFVSLAAPAALLLEVGASCALFGGLTRLLDRIGRGLQTLGYRTNCALAPTPLGALWLARAGAEARVTDARALFNALAPLPLACLGLERNGEALLAGIGLTCIADCLRLPRDGLARRAGPEVVNALDRAFGRLPDARRAYLPAREFHARLPMPAPVDSVEALLFPLRRLLGELAGWLTALAAGIPRLIIVLRHDRSAATRIDVNFSAPTRDAAHILLIVRERLERTPLPAPVEEISVTADALQPLGSCNLDFFSGARAPAEARAHLTERLQARLGTEAVHGLDQRADHRPESAWRFSAPGQAPTCSETNTVGGARPLWLLPAPLLLEQRDGRPWWRGALTVEDDRERIESGWWDGGGAARDYFIARDAAGARLWVFRELYDPRRWFLHGVFG